MPLQMCVVYSTKDGNISCTGSTMLSSIIQSKCVAALLNSELWIDEEMVNSPTSKAFTLPKLPKPASQLSAESLQTVLTQTLRNLYGG